MQRNETTRERLAGLTEGERYSFEAKFKRLGVDRRFPDQEKILLVDIYLVLDNNEKELMTDHVWISKSKRWKRALTLVHEDCTVAFTAEIKKYLKEGKRDYFEDYGLSSLRSVEVLENEEN